jgi:UMF1 family MFS transporter
VEVEADNLTGREARDARRSVLSWCFYDWANSAFHTVIITFVFATYFAQRVAESPEAGTSLWGAAMSLSGIAIAIGGPVVGALADGGGRRKPWLAVFTALAIVATAAMWFVRPDPSFVVLALVLAVGANVAFEFGQIFYNALLPELVPAHRVGRISGWAWGLGYAGGLLCMGIVLFVFVRPDPALFGLDRENFEHVRATALLVAVWFGVFALPLFLFSSDRPSSGLKVGAAMRSGLVGLVGSVRRLRQSGTVARFLIARMIYTDGINTLFIFGGIYAAGTFGMSTEEVLYFAIVILVAAGIGATSFAWIDDWIGAKPTIMIALAALTVFGVAVLLIESKTWFYVLAACLGIFVGPAQAASRSLMAHLAPADLRGEMFGLYALSGRITAFIGPAVVGWVTFATGSQRWGMATIPVFLVVGFALMVPLRVPRPASTSS